MHIAIAGNIGAGKTTLTELLANHYHWDAHFETVENNPYLDDFYHDMERWSFNLQVYFLNNRFEQILKIQQSGKNIIQDRTIYEDAKIFAPNLHGMGLLSSRDFKNYNQLFNLMENLVTPPDLLIYLKANTNTLQKQINIRGRAYENTISLDYLNSLNNRYNDWIDQYNKGPKLILDADNLDFVSNQADLQEIIQKIDSLL